MKLLLDTHVLIGVLNGDQCISAQTIRRVDHERNDLHISVASLWEMAIKLGTGKLSISGTFNGIFPLLSRNKITVVEIMPSHLNQLITLPNIHKDPFDRLIIAQSLANGFALITDDNIIKAYPGLTLLE